MALELEFKNKLLIEINKKPEDIITAVQNDTNSRWLDVYLYSNGIPINLTGCEVKILAKKPNSTGDVFDYGTITDAESGRCQFEFSTGMLSTVGVMETQIQIWKDNTSILSTEIFNILVGRSLLSESSVESSNEYGALVILFQNLYQALYLMEQMVNNFGTAGTIAEARNILNFWQGIEYIAKYVDTTLAQKIDDVIANASVQGVLNLIGTAADTGATDTTGTIMGKLNNLLKAEAEKNVQWLSTETTVKGMADAVLVDVTGKGKIRYVYFYGVGDGSISLEVDGRTVVTFKSLGTSGKRLSGYLFSKKDFLWESNKIRHPERVLRLETITNINVGDRKIPFFPEYTTSGDSHTYHYSQVGDGIPFENGFKIVGRGLQTTDNHDMIGEAWYSLE